jgi:hypothetical protein
MNPAGSPPGGASSDQERRHRPRPFLGAAAGIVLLVAAVWLLPKWFSDRRPADFRIDGRSLVVANKSGRELWRYAAGSENLQTAEFYRERFQFKRTKTGPDGVSARVLPLLIIRDVNRDGRNEVLFSPQFADERPSGRIILLDGRGRMVWEFETGKEIRLGPATIARDFICTGFDTIDLDEDGKLEFLVVSQDRENSLSRVLILDGAAAVRGEYWNAGRISDFALADFDRDFQPELLLAGRNDEFEKPCLVLLDPARMKGGSPQGEAFRFVDAPPGQEMIYLLFPRSPVGEIKRAEVEISRFDVLRAERIRTTLEADETVYELDFDLRPLTVELRSGFADRYAEAVHEGKARGPLDPDKVRRDLLAGLRWYDGQTKSWSAAWALSNPWPERGREPAPKGDRTAAR